jgi:hypothetical protein
MERKSAYLWSVVRNQKWSHCRVAILHGLYSGEVAMVIIDWRSEQDYANFEKAEIADIAREWLRRDSEYQREFKNLTSAAQSSRTPHQFRKKWGLSFRGRS